MAYSEKKRAYNKAYWATYKRRPRTKQEIRKANLKKFNLTQRDYENLLAEQGGHCYFCAKTPAQQRHGVLFIDHCHETGRVRGLVCAQHNQALVRFGDNVAGFERALAYVRGDFAP